MEWRQQHPRLPNGLLDLPSGLPTWLNNDLPVRVAVLLPLSGRLKDAGERVLQGVTEGFFDSYRDAALRPQLITVDTELASSGRAAYLTALERGADFVIGPLTKERVAELQALDSLPIPVLALNRGATGVSTSFFRREAAFEPEPCTRRRGNSVSGAHLASGSAPTNGYCARLRVGATYALCL
jgi:outer membrane PBP1 activator LpoA protein